MFMPLWIYGAVLLACYHLGKALPAGAKYSAITALAGIVVAPIAGISGTFIVQAMALDGITANDIVGSAFLHTFWALALAVVATVYFRKKNKNEAIAD